MYLWMDVNMSLSVGRLYCKPRNFQHRENVIVISYQEVHMLVMEVS